MVWEDESVGLGLEDGYSVVPDAAKKFILPLGEPLKNIHSTFFRPELLLKHVGGEVVRVVHLASLVLHFSLIVLALTLFKLFLTPCLAMLLLLPIPTLLFLATLLAYLLTLLLAQLLCTLLSTLLLFLLAMSHRLAAVLALLEFLLGIS
jgi:hypothetical protein